MNLKNVFTWAELEFRGVRYYEELSVVEKSLGKDNTFKFLLNNVGYEARVFDNDTVAMPLSVVIKLALEFVKNSPKSDIEYVESVRRDALKAGVLYDNTFICSEDIGANCAKLAQ